MSEFDKMGCQGDCSACESGCESGNIDLSQPTVTLTLDNDEEVTCAVLRIFQIEEQQYIALLPLNADGESENGEVYLYQFYEDANGNPNLDNIEDDEEYEKAAVKFNEMMEMAELGTVLEGTES